MYHVSVTTTKFLERDCIEDFNKCLLVRRHRRTITDNKLIINKIKIGINRKVTHIIKSNNSLVFTDDYIMAQQ